MSLLERHYYIASNDVTEDLSNNNIIDTSVGPIYIGKKTLLSGNGQRLFISSLKSIASGNNGDVFVYDLDSNDISWNYQTSLYSTIYTDISNHDYQNGMYPANIGNELKCSYDGNTLYVGIPGYRTSNINHGAISILSYANSSWSCNQTITNDFLTNHNFGASIAVNETNDVLFIGTNVQNYTPSNVFRFTKSSNLFSKDSTFDIKPVNNGITSNFGNKLDCDACGNKLLVGSTNFSYYLNGNNRYTGTAQLYEYNTSNQSWNLKQDFFNDICNNLLTNATLANGNNIGKSIQIDSSGEKIIISTELTNGSKTGAIYYFLYNSSTNSYDFKQLLTNPVYSGTYGEDTSLSKNGNHLVISTLHKNIYYYYYDTSSFWIENQESIMNQNIITDINNNTNTNLFSNQSSIHQLGNSISIDNNASFLSFGIKNYRFDSPSTNTEPITGQHLVLKSKKLQTISFPNYSQFYSETISLNATSNSSTSPTYIDPNTSNSIYTLSNQSISIIGLGTATIKTQFPSDKNYMLSEKEATVTGNQASQHIQYTAAITTQGTIGIGQRSGLIYDVYNSQTNNISPLSATFSINGSSVQFDSTRNEFEGVTVGTSTVTILQTGDLYHAPAVPVQIVYNVTQGWSSSYPPSYTPGYVPTEEGLSFNASNESLISEIPNTSDITNLLLLPFSEKNKSDNDKIYSIPITKGETINELKRTTLQNQNNTFHMQIKDLADSINYISVSIKDASNVSLYQNMNVTNKSILQSIINPTNIFQIEKYNNDTKVTNEYNTVRIYHPYDTLVLYHIDDSENVKQVTTTNFPNSSIQRDMLDSNYWFVKMPFSSGLGGTSSNNNPSGNICFTGDMLLETDQGIIKIRNFNTNYHTIRNQYAYGLTEMNHIEKFIILIPKNTFEKNLPTEDLYVSVAHHIFYKKWKTAGQFEKEYEKIKYIPYDGLLYNLLFTNHNIMKVNGCLVETLYPNHMFAQYYREIVWNPSVTEKEKQCLNQKLYQNIKMY